MTDSQSWRRLFQRGGVEPTVVHQGRLTTIVQLDPVLVVV